MNVVSSRPRLKTKLHHESDENHGINFYHDLPNYELTLDEFEEYALARLKVLRKIEELKIRNVKGNLFETQLDSTLKSLGYLDRNAAAKRLDDASHFVLRAAFCRTEDQRRWFLTHEVYLFRHRLSKALERNGILESLLEQYGITLPKLEQQEKENFRSELQTASNMSPAEFERTNFFKIPFEQVLDLVASRSCLIQRGEAYVPQTKVISVLVAKFRTQLSKSLALACANFFPLLKQEEGRMAPLLKDMSVQSTSSHVEQTIEGVELTAANVDSYAKYMPLCMAQLHNGMKRDGKLRHWGRLQYGLFLKGAGLSMEDSLQFFQKFFHSVSGETFQKDYSYNIRHMYGKEGKRASYTPYNCVKIILGQAPQGSMEHHGCPYKHYDEEHLGALLNRMQIGTAADRKDIVGLAKRHHQPNLACARHYHVMHPNNPKLQASTDNVGNHPNAWFQASMAYNKASSEQDKTPIVTPTK